MPAQAYSLQEEITTYICLAPLPLETENTADNVVILFDIKCFKSKVKKEQT